MKFAGPQRKSQVVVDFLRESTNPAPRRSPELSCNQAPKVDFRRKSTTLLAPWALQLRLRLASFALWAAVYSPAPIAHAEEPAESAASPPVAAEFVELAVYPPQVRLEHGADAQRVIAVATRADGVTVDVTSQVQWSRAGEGPELLAVDAGVVTPRAVGNALLQAQLGELTAATDVQVAAVDPPGAPEFRHDVMPVFMRAGCNAGGCHGAALGKDGFQLSLFGYDPAGDYYRLTRQLSTRRINRALPDDSLLLQKAIAGVPHTGGKRFTPDDEYYAAIHDWIAAGAGDDAEQAATVESLQIYPPQAVLEGSDAAQQFIAVATYSDGEQRDVTDLAVFLSNNDASAAVGDSGLVTAANAGEAFVTARFDVHTVGSQVLSLSPEAKYEPPAEPPANFIDELVEAKLSKLRVSPSGLCTDDEFLRRVTIDLAGRLPTAEERAALHDDQSPERREHVVDALLASPDFVDVWALKWAEILLVRSEPNRVEYKPMYLYWQWIRNHVAAGTPADAMVRELISASGSSFLEPEVNFYQIEPDAKKIAENAAQAFLGIRVQCAQCHNHPFDRWTMDDYYSFAAFFSQIARKRTEDYREILVFNRGGGESTLPVTGKAMPPKFLGGEQPEINRRDRREVVAEWIASPDNPYFAANLANRAWSHMLGVGIVEPVDDVRVSNPPSNPELLDALAARLVKHEFDIRKLLRDIATSYAYQRTVETTAGNAHDQRNFAHALVRRIPAEALLDCVSQATGAPERLPGLPPGARALEVADGNGGNYFLTAFGRSKRTTVCACEASAEPTLSQALHMLNGNTVHGKITQGGLVKTWLEEGRTPAEVIAAIYDRCLGRAPSEAESQQLLALCGDNEKPVAELEDAFWAVLNSREFLFNH